MFVYNVAITSEKDRLNMCWSNDQEKTELVCWKTFSQLISCGISGIAGWSVLNAIKSLKIRLLLLVSDYGEILLTDFFSIWFYFCSDRDCLHLQSFVRCCSWLTSISIDRKPSTRNNMFRIRSVTGTISIDALRNSSNIYSCSILNCSYDLRIG